MVPGSLYPVFGGYVLLSVLYILYTCSIGLKTSHGQKHRLFSRILIGSGLTALGGLVFNIMLPLVGYPSLPALGAASSIFIVLFMGLGVLDVCLLGSILSSVGLVFLIMLIVAVVFVVAIFFSFILASVFF